MDTVGLAHVRSAGGKWYVLVVVNDFSRYSWVFFLESKEEVFGFVRDLTLRLQNELPKHFENLCSLVFRIAFHESYS